MATQKNTGSFDLDITPHPQILGILAMASLSWIDALSELIDNSVDSFGYAERVGEPVKNPQIELFIPTLTDVKAGKGEFIIRDNGFGLDRQGINNAITAGFSGQTQFASLGLFGVGFNIASGKIGPKTTILSARKSDNFASEVVLDLDELIRTGKYEVEGHEVPKPEGLEQGTIIKIGGTYAKGHQNAEFASRIASKSGNQVLDQLGRRYATCIKDKGIAIRVYETPASHNLVKPFEHCVWSSERTTAAASALKKQQIPAQIFFDESLGSFKRCVECGRYIPDGVDKCEIETHTNAPQTIESKVRGWVGIQRFDDANRYGIDLIRNGRTILRGEKSLFFEVTDEGGNKIKEYPLNDINGRIVGEVHLDGCRVDYLKQQFQADAMFEKALKFLRGEALRPQGPKNSNLSWEEGYVNDSPISKLYSAYDRVRFTKQATSPKDVLYPATWDNIKKQPKRIGREWERAAYEKFLNKEDGWFDDANWFERVEFGGMPPQVDMKNCPVCDTQNDLKEEQCITCSTIFEPKACINCEQPILPSASSCQHCGTPQWGDDVHETEWECDWCSYKTPAEEVICGQCGHNRGSPAPLTIEALENDSSLWDEFCFENLSIPLTSTQSSRELFLKVFTTSNPIKAKWDSDLTLPLAVFKDLDQMTIFVDSRHNIFTQFDTQPKTLIANEVAHFILKLNQNTLLGSQEFNHSAITSKILQEYFEGNSDSSVALIDEVNQFFSELADRLCEDEETQEFYNNLPSSDQQAIATELQLSGELEKHSITELVENGMFLSFMPKRFFGDFFLQFPNIWLEKIWLEYEKPDPEVLGQENAELFHKLTLGFLQRALGDCGALADTPENYLDEDKIGRAATGLQVLQKRAYA